MERPGVVWVFCILAVIGIIWNLISGITLLTVGGSLFSPLMYYVFIFIYFVLIIPTIIFVYLFFMLKRSSLIWLYIAYGLGIVLNLVVMQWIVAVIMALFGWAIWDYIMHKKIDGKQVFT